MKFMKWARRSTLLAIISIGWVIYQGYIFIYPQDILIQRPIHMVFAVAVCFLAFPLAKGSLGTKSNWIDWACVVLACFIGLYYILDWARLLEHMVFIDQVFPRDYISALVFTGLLLEGTRRTAGMSLVYVTAFFILYALLGSWFPGWLGYQGMNYLQFTEIMFMSDSGVFGIPAQVSVDYLFYFILFGALFSASGGGQLFTDLGLKVVSRTKGGAAKAAVISSGLFGMISGSAVANVTVSGVFTIPLMKKSGYSGIEAGATEAAASAGGQLMPPVMGAGAFLMAELLGVPYFDVVKAAILPALAFYLSLFFIIDFNARRTGIGNITKEAAQIKLPIFPRLHLLAPVLLLIYFIYADYSVGWAIVMTILAVIVVSMFRQDTRLTPSRFVAACLNGTKQVAAVAVPIGAIGIIIGVAIQSGLAMKFSTMLMVVSSGSTIGILFMVILGLVVLGMGLPTVAAYLMGAIFFVSPLVSLGVPLLAAHLFVFYYSILSAVTPPVALAAFTAAGLANESVSKTGWAAFRLCWVCFLIPFVFIYDQGMLLQGPFTGIAIASITTVLGIVAWAAMLSGYFLGPLSWLERALFLIASIGLIAPTIAGVWYPTLIFLIFLASWRMIIFIFPRFRLRSAFNNIFLKNKE